MIESIIINYLNSALSVKAYAEKPQTNESSFVVVEKTGNSETNMIGSAVVAIQSYAPSLYEAATLNESVKEAMRNMYELGSISNARLNTDYNFTDPTKKQYRYQAVFDIAYFL